MWRALAWTAVVLMAAAGGRPSYAADTADFPTAHPGTNRPNGAEAPDGPGVEFDRHVVEFELR